MGRRLVGLDLEMSGVNWEENEVIQIGLSLDPRVESENFVSDVGWAKNDYLYNPESLEVIGWTHERIWAGPPVEDVEDALMAFCEDKGLKKGTLIPVGFAVKSFDMPFVASTFPRFTELFIRPKTAPKGYGNYLFRTCDLTDVTYGMVGVGDKAKKGFGFNGWKKAGKAYAADELKKIGIDENYHDALYDARNALLTLEYYNTFKGV